MYKTNEFIVYRRISMIFDTLKFLVKNETVKLRLIILYGS